MRYMGGKSRVAKGIAATMLEATSNRSVYVEPFLGGGSVAVQMVPHFGQSYLSDAHHDLIILWQALQLGWEPPDSVSEEFYRQLRDAGPSAIRGFVGYACSFGGKWFGGYARGVGRNYAGESRNLLLRKIPALTGARITHTDYRNVEIPDGAVVYLDPPYAGTTGYGAVGAFDTVMFWKWAETLSARASVFVSEYHAPDGWESAWSATPHVSLSRTDKTRRASEHLWVCSRLQVRASTTERLNE